MRWCKVFGTSFMLKSIRSYYFSYFKMLFSLQTPPSALVESMELLVDSVEPEGGNLLITTWPQTVKRLPVIQETWVWSLGWEDPLEKEMATHSSTLAWKIPWMEEPSRLQSRGHKESDTTERLSFPFLSFTWLSLQQCVQEMHISVLSFPRIFWAYKRNPRINYFQSQVLMLKCFLRQSPTETSYFTVSAGFA